MRILLVEDSKRLADSLSDVLKKEQFIVDIASDGEAGYSCALTKIYDLVILDLMLPAMDGYEVLQRLRKNKNDVPVLILSAKSEIDDKIEGFRVGADDYMTKPFDIRELVMRIHAIVNRRGKNEFIKLQTGNLQMDISACKLINIDSKKEIKIAGKELQLMEFFLRNGGQVLEREQIVTRVWGYESDTEYNNVEVYTTFIRRKLKFLQVNVRIRSVRGVGYILEVFND